MDGLVPTEGQLSRRALLAGVAAAAASGALASCATDERSVTARAVATPSVTGVPGPGDVTSPPPSRSLDRSPAGADLQHGPRDVAAVALTFHGFGDPALTRRALKILAAAHAHATVLAVGTWLEANPHLASAVLDGGHDLGNHTWSHQVMPRLSRSAAEAEVSRCARLLR